MGFQINNDTRDRFIVNVSFQLDLLSLSTYLLTHMNNTSLFLSCFKHMKDQLIFDLGLSLAFLEKLILLVGGSSFQSERQSLFEASFQKKVQLSFKTGFKAPSMTLGQEADLSLFSVRILSLA